MSWHDCDPWVKVYGACPVSGRPQPPNKEGGAVDWPTQDDELEKERELEPSPVPYIGHRPVTDGEKHEQQILDELEKERQREWTLPSPPPHWEKIAAGALVAGAAALMSNGYGGSEKALAKSERMLPRHMRTTPRPSTARRPGYLVNFSEKLLNMEAIPQKRKRGWKRFWDTTGPGSASLSDPDVPGPGPALPDFGEWYYLSYERESDGSYSIRTRRGPAWIDPADPRWAETYGAFWATGPTEQLGSARPPRSHETAPGFWEDDPSVFGEAPSGAGNDGNAE